MTTEPALTTHPSNGTDSPPAKRVKVANNPLLTTMAAPPLLVKKLSDKARLPTRGSAFAAGYDVYASQATVVPARGKALVDTDISIACPAGTCEFPTPPTTMLSSAVIMGTIFP